MSTVGNITFNPNPILDVTIYGKLETLETVWLFEMGESYEALHIKRIYRSKKSAMSHVPNGFIFDMRSTSKSLYYEGEWGWIKISEMWVEKE